MKNFLKNNGIWALAIVVLGLIPFGSYLFSDKLLIAMDAISTPLFKFYLDGLREGVVALWNPYFISGMPTFDALFGDSGYPLFILFSFLMPLERVVTALLIVETLIAGLGAFFLVRRFFAVPRFPALALAVAYMFNANFFSYIYGGHIGKYHIMAWLPIGLFFLLRSLQSGSRWYHLAGLCLTTALFISSSHLQFTYFVMMGYFVAWVFKSWGLLRARAFAGFAHTAVKFWIPLVLGVGLAFPIFYPPTQWNKYFSVRGEGERVTYEHATSWSIHPEEAASLIVPEFAGINENYWGRNPFKLNTEYPGLTVLFLSAFGLAVFRRRWMWLWAGVGLLATVYALGGNTPVFHLFYNFVPGVKSFRAAGMMMFWLATALLLISAQTLALLCGNNAAGSPKVRKRLLQWGLGVAGALLLAGLLPSAVYGIWNAFVSPGEIANFARQSANESAFAFGALRAAVLLAALVLALWKFGLRDRNWAAFSLVLVAVTWIDLYSVNRHFLKPYTFSQAYPTIPAIEAIKSDTSAFRVFALPGTQFDKGYLPYHEIESIDNYADHEYTLYRSLRGDDHANNPNFFAGLQQAPEGHVFGSPILDLLNVKYLIFRGPQDGIVRAVENASRLPRAWLAYDWEDVPEAEALARVKTPGFDPRVRALVSSGDSIDVPAAPGAGAGSVRLVHRDPNRQEFEVETDAPALLAISELYFPFWNFEIDGKPAAQVRTNYAFRGVFLPAGSHRVVAEYRSPWIALGLKVSLLSALALFLLLVGNRYLTARLERGAWKA